MLCQICMSIALFTAVETKKHVVYVDTGGSLSGVRIKEMLQAWNSSLDDQVHTVFDVIISNMRKSVSSGYANPEKWVEKTRCSLVLLPDFEVFGYRLKHSFEYLIWLLKPFIILGEIQSKSLQNFMLIKIRYPNHRHSSDFLCFLFMNY